MALPPFSSATPAATYTLPGKVRQSVYNVRDYSATADGTTNDLTAIQNTVNAAAAAGGGIVYFPQGTYSVSGPIEAKSNVTFLGVGSASILKTTANGFIISNGSTALNDVTIDSLTFIGTVNQTVSAPTRARTTSGNGTTIAISLDGSLDPNVPAAPIITNFVMRNSNVRNCSSLPIRIFGITGKVMVTDCEFTNCMDVGFGYNQEVICSNNHSYMSADNGFSISRGNKKITCTGNTVELCAYFAYWLSGFNISGTEIGPQNFTVTGNTARDFGQAGIKLADAPKYGVISSNTLDSNYRRGTTDGPDDTFCCGIFVRGDPSDTPSAPVDFANGLLITNNNIYRAPRAGIYLNGCKNVVAASNLILDCGTQFLSDGTTAIASSSTTQNVGILIDQTATITHVHLIHNIIIDSRVSPFCNWGIVPATTSSMFPFGNIMQGCRNAFNLVSNLTQGEFLAFSTASDITMTSDGTDLTAAVNGRLQLVAGNSNGVLSGFNMNNPNTGTAAGAGALFSAGIKTAFIGGFFNYRLDTSANAIFGIRILSNSTLTGTTTAAPFYLSGSATGITTHLNSGLQTQVVTKTANYTATLGDHKILVDSTGGAVTITLPTAASVAGLEFVVKDWKGQSLTNNITVATTASQTIDGASTKVLNIAYASFTFTSDGANWSIV